MVEGNHDPRRAAQPVKASWKAQASWNARRQLVRAMLLHAEGCRQEQSRQSRALAYIEANRSIATEGRVAVNSPRRSLARKQRPLGRCA